jgi:hypothetical protein
MVLEEYKVSIELKAAKAAINWTNLFADLLHAAARASAKDCELVTIEHFRRALPMAASQIVAAIESGNAETADVEPQAA